MATFKINDVTGGVNKDVVGFAQPASTWTDLNNVAIKDGTIRPVEGYDQLFANLSFEPTGLFKHSTGTTFFYVTTGANGRVYRQSTIGNGALTQITLKADSDGYNNITDSDVNWDGHSISTALVLNSTKSNPYFMKAGDTTLTQWTDSDWSYGADQTRAEWMFVLDDVIFAGNLTEINNDIITPRPVTVRNSQRFTGNRPSFRPTTANIANELELAGAEETVAGLALRGKGIVYSRAGFYSISPTAATQALAPKFVYKQVGHTRGCWNKNTVQGYRGAHVVWSPQDIYVHQGEEVTAESIFKNIVIDYLNKDMDPTHAPDRCFIHVDTTEQAIYFCYPKVGSRECDRALVWYIGEPSKAVSFQDMPNVRGATLGPVPGSAQRKTVVVSKDDQKLYEFNKGNTFNGTAFNCTAEKTGITNVMIGNDADMIVEVKNLYVWFTSDSDIEVSFGSAFDPTTDITYKTMTMKPDDWKFTCHQKGRVFASKFDFSSKSGLRLTRYEAGIGSGGMK